MSGIFAPQVRRLLSLAALLLLASCASTTLRDSWYYTDYRGGVPGRVFVLAVNSSGAERRTMEDAMVAAIDATGSHAVRGYRHLPGDGKETESAIDNAVHAAQADALLMIRLKRIETRTQVMPPPAVYGPRIYGWGWYGWYDAWYAAPNVYQYDVATVETSLFDARTRQLVWSGTTETLDPFPVAAKAPEFSRTIVSALQARGLLYAPRGG